MLLLSGTVGALLVRSDTRSNLAPTSDAHVNDADSDHAPLPPAPIHACSPIRMPCSLRECGTPGCRISSLQHNVNNGSWSENSGDAQTLD